MSTRNDDAGDGRQVPPIDRERLVAASLLALDDYRQASDTCTALEARVKPDVSPEVWAIVEQLLEARTLQMEASTDLFVAELVRHFPGMAPALMTVWNHVSGAFFDSVGNCCTPPLRDPQSD